jgi:hypothetical protein
MVTDADHVITGTTTESFVAGTASFNQLSTNGTASGDKLTATLLVTPNLTALSGSFTVAALQPPSIVSVTPSSGAGFSQQFSFVNSSPYGASYLTGVFMLINNSLSTMNACFLYYSPAQNLLYLFSNSGSSIGTGAAPGASTTLTNSQCSVDLSTTTVTPNGNSLTVAPNITFTMSFTGSKNIYVSIRDQADSTAGWTQEGTWEVGLAAESAPTAVSVTPNSGTGTTQQFQFAGSSPVGYQNLLAYYMLIAPSFNTVNNCYMKYVSAGNLFYLMNDAGTTWSAGAQPGSGTTLSNSQCSIPMSSLTVSGSGTTLTVSPTITFTNAYAGAKNIYLDVADNQNENSGFQTLGTWTVGAIAEAPPTAVSVTPSSGSGLGPQQFSFVGSSPVGASNLSEFYMYIQSPGGATATACYLKYIAGGNMLYLYSGGNFSLSGQVGSSNTLSNSICSVDLSTTTVTPSGTTLTVTPNITFTGASPGSKALSLDVVDQANESSGFVQLGTWTIP